MRVHAKRYSPAAQSGHVVVGKGAAHARHARVRRRQGGGRRPAIFEARALPQIITDARALRLDCGASLSD